jgi:hypothetical protein
MADLEMVLASSDLDAELERRAVQRMAKQADMLVVCSSQLDDARRCGGCPNRPGWCW